ncbi:MAG: hypothetical protein NW237_06645 [Cyanobacteriota bacterium]|nr:hypothetical protein [Cyanobacteriota bacterium]
MMPASLIRSSSRQIVLLLLCVVLGIGSVGCAPLARLGLGVTEISTVVNNPANYPQVTIRGKVVNQIGIFGQGAYELQDDSGSIWVITTTGIPAIDSTVTVQGKASEGLAIAGRNVGVTLAETKRL